MMKILFKTLILLAALTSLPAIAQQAQEFDDYIVHYNALSSSLITPEVAKAYGIRRSDSRALINISVLKNAEGKTATAVKAKVTASGRNLTGQTRNVDMREIDDGDGAVVVLVEGQNKPFNVKFRQQFYTE